MQRQTCGIYVKVTWMSWSYWKKWTKCTSWNKRCTGWRKICSFLNMDSRKVRVRQFYVKKQDGVFACQKKYVIDLVKKFNMFDCEKALTTINYDMWYSNLCNFNYVGWTCIEWTRSLDEIKAIRKIALVLSLVLLFGVQRSKKLWHYHHRSREARNYGIIIMKWSRIMHFMQEQEVWSVQLWIKGECWLIQSQSRI